MKQKRLLPDDVQSDLVARPKKILKADDSPSTDLQLAGPAQTPATTSTDQSAMVTHQTTHSTLQSMTSRHQSTTSRQQSTTKTFAKDGFFVLPREIRDEIYKLCVQDIDYAHQCHAPRDEDSTIPNSWTISHVGGPWLKCMAITKQFSAEYTDTVFKNMQLVAHFNVLQNNRMAAAPWYDSLPIEVRNSTRVARLVICLDSMSTPARFTTHERQTFVQRLMNSTATALPRLHTLDVMHSNHGHGSDSIESIEGLTLESSMRELLRLQPTSRIVPNVTSSLLVDLEWHPGYVLEDEEFGFFPGNDFPFWDQVTSRLVKDGRVPAGPPSLADFDYMEEDRPIRAVRWQARLPTDESANMYKGLNWQIVATLSATDVEDDEEADIKWPSSGGRPLYQPEAVEGSVAGDDSETSATDSLEEDWTDSDGEDDEDPAIRALERIWEDEEEQEEQARRERWEAEAPLRREREAAKQAAEEELDRAYEAIYAEMDARDAQRMNEGGQEHG